MRDGGLRHWSLLGAGWSLLALARGRRPAPQRSGLSSRRCRAGRTPLATSRGGVWRPARALRPKDWTAARQAGVLLPAMASDFARPPSELAEPGEPVSRAASGRAGLVQAFFKTTLPDVGDARRSRASSCRCARPWARSPSPAARGRGAGRGAPGGRRCPRAGLRTLDPPAVAVRRRRRIDGALVGDVRITYSYPAYTGLLSRTRRGLDRRHRRREGDARAHRDPPAARARAARCCCSAKHGEKGEIAAKVHRRPAGRRADGVGGRELPVLAAADFGRAVREVAQHHMTAEADSAPRVEIMGPADRLELATPRPMEIGYRPATTSGLASSSWSPRRRTSRAADAAARRQRRAPVQGRTCGIRRRPG